MDKLANQYIEIILRDVNCSKINHMSITGCYYNNMFAFEITINVDDKIMYFSDNTSIEGTYVELVEYVKYIVSKVK